MDRAYHRGVRSPTKLQKSSSQVENFSTRKFYSQKCDYKKEKMSLKWNKLMLLCDLYSYVKESVNLAKRLPADENRQPVI